MEEEKTNERVIDKHYVCPSGDPILPVLQWDESGKNVVKVGERNLQKEIDELSKGCTVGEQIARLFRGDESVLQPGGVYADVSGAPESDLEAMQERVKFTSNLERLALQNGCTVEELSKKLDEREKKLKQEQDARLAELEEIAKQKESLKEEVK